MCQQRNVCLVGAATVTAVQTVTNLKHHKLSTSASTETTIFILRILRKNRGKEYSPLVQVLNSVAKNTYSSTEL